MSRWCSLALCACGAVAALADVPTPEAPWFAIDFTQPWQATCGTWTVPDGADCLWTASPARMEFSGLTNSTLAFAPSASAVGAVVSVEATLTLNDNSITTKMPDLPIGSARGALAVLEKSNHSLVYLGLSAQGWVELAGATPVLDQTVVFRIAYDTSSPPRVSYFIDGRMLTDASDESASSFETVDTQSSPSVELYGAGEISALAGSCELVERQAAVVQANGSFSYHADIAEACSAATNGAEVMLLRPVRDLDWSATSSGTPLRLASRLVHSRQPLFTLGGEVPPGARLALDMPSGEAVDCVLFGPVDSAAQDAVHVHGDPAVVYTLLPDDTVGVRLRSGSVSLDPGGFLGFLSVPYGAHAFVGGLSAGDLGTTGSLYLQGGAVTLCGTNTYTGATVVESGTLTLCGELTSSAVQVWRHGEFVGSPPTGGVFAVEGSARVDAPLANAALEDGATVAFELAVAESGAILVPSSALPPAGSVAVSVAVEGPFAATTRTVLSGDVVVAVAGAPELAAISSAFAVAEDGVSAVIANAVAGFWYSWEAADTLAGPFLPVGSPVCARFDGELVLTLAEPMRARRFYRLCVTAEP